ncbi:MAG TPA: RNA polymerase sigma factor [Candidatus Limnocylindrales bacterium]|nr:RNA polymerase sigma factor [Candidatus Limnocylindrales bacterium]
MDPRVEPLDADPVPIPVVAGANADAFVTAAWTALHGELFGFLVRCTRDGAAAEDLLQEAFLRLTTEVRAGRIPDNVRAWLFRVASNLAISRSRRVSVAVRWLGRFGASEARTTSPSPETGALGRERTDAMERALDRLPPDARLALVLAGSGFRGRDIADTIGRSEVATRALMSRARVTVRRYLAEEEAR